MQRNHRFEIRYAVRVLERDAALWRRIDLAVRGAGLLAGTTALAALTASSTVAAVALGLTFALAQAVEVIVRPSEKAAAALAQRRPYADLLAALPGMSADDAIAQLERIIAADELHVPQALRVAAYNDVAIEQGSPEYCDRLTILQRAVASIS